MKRALGCAASPRALTSSNSRFITIVTTDLGRPKTCVRNVRSGSIASV